MNLETVNELIQSLESAGELSIKETKVMELAKAYQQLAAENVQVRERHRFVRALAVSILEHSGGRRDWRGAMEDASDFLKTVDEVYSNTPATDRIVAGIKADGVEEFAALTEKVADEEEFYDNGESAESLKYTAKQARLFAKQLREGGRQMLKPNHVYIEVCHNQSGGLSLCVSNDSGGYRISGSKVGGCETLECFEVDASELIEQIREHANTEVAK